MLCKPNDAALAPDSRPQNRRVRLKHCSAEGDEMGTPKNFVGSAIIAGWCQPTSPRSIGSSLNFETATS